MSSQGDLGAAWAALKATARAAEQLASELQRIQPEQGGEALVQARADTMRLTLACLDLAVSVGKLEAKWQEVAEKSSVKQ